VNSTVRLQKDSQGALNMASKTLTFIGFENIPKAGDYTDIRFDFSIVDTSFVGTPEEGNNTSEVEVLVRISRTLEAIWTLAPSQLDKVSYEFAKRHLQDKVSDGTDTPDERIDLNTSTAERECPYNPERISMTPGSRYEVEVRRHFGFRTS
jgi:hypothetical protein